MIRFISLTRLGLQVEEVEDHKFLARAQEIVGGYIAAAFTLPMPGTDDKNRYITGYVDDEGLCKQQPLNVTTAESRNGRVVGDMVLVGLDDSNGGTVSLTDDEIAAVHKLVAVKYLIFL